MNSKILLIFVLVGSIACFAAEKNADEKEWPKTKDEAVDQILSQLDDESRKRLLNESKENLIKYHHGWGTGIRNGFGLWKGNTDLLAALGDKEMHPDSASMLIIEAVWQALRDKSPNKRQLNAIDNLLNDMKMDDLSFIEMSAGKLVKTINKRIKQFAKKNKGKYVELKIKLHRDSDPKQKVLMVCWQPCLLRNVVEQALIRLNGEKELILPNTMVVKLGKSDTQYWPKIHKDIVVYELPDDEMIYMKWQKKIGHSVKVSEVSNAAIALSVAVPDKYELSGISILPTEFGACNKYLDISVNFEMLRDNRVDSIIRSYFNDQMYVSKIDHQFPESYPKWDDLKKDPPLLLGDASMLSRDYLNKLVSDSLSYEVVRSGLERVNNKNWIYIFTYSTSEVKEGAPNISILVLMNGKVVPFDKVKNGTRMVGSSYLWSFKKARCDLD